MRAYLDDVVIQNWRNRVPMHLATSTVGGLVTTSVLGCTTPVAGVLGLTALFSSTSLLVAEERFRAFQDMPPKRRPAIALPQRVPQWTEARVRPLVAGMLKDSVAMAAATVGFGLVMKSGVALGVSLLAAQMVGIPLVLWGVYLWQKHGIPPDNRGVQMQHLFHGVAVS